MLGKTREKINFKSSRRVDVDMRRDTVFKKNHGLVMKIVDFWEFQFVHGFMVKRLSR